MAARSIRGGISRAWPPRFLRWLLIWPLVRAYRRKTRTRLSWRLAGSHFATVLVSVFSICVVTMVIALVQLRVSTPVEGEAAYEAREVVQIVEGVMRDNSVTDDQLSGVLFGVMKGAVAPNYSTQDVTIGATVGRTFQNIQTVSLVAPGGAIQASSDPSLVGQSSAQLDPASRQVLDAARSTDGNPGMDSLSAGRDDGSVVGAYRAQDSAGELIGMIIVDKSRRSFPSGPGFVLLLFSFVAQFGIVLLVLVGVPAIPVGIVFGIRRARAISRPITALARAGDAFGQGERSARVTVQGRDEISELQAGFNEMADLLESTMMTEAEQRTLAETALAANRDLIANVSHELRTPVALIRGHLEALESDPEARDAYVRIALRETDRLEHLVNDLFQLSRLEANQMEMDIDVFDAGSAVRSAVESLVEPARREAGLSVRFSVTGAHLPAIGDRLRFEQVLQNLVRNAIRFTPEGGIILVSAERGSSSDIVVSVSDTGVGISGADLPRVFDRFYRADKSRTRAGGGAGLGLSIAKAMIEAMGSAISVSSVPDEGTVFTVRLPAARIVQSPVPRSVSVV